MRTNYTKGITESEAELLNLEKRYRGKRVLPRIQMLRLLKTGQVKSQESCAEQLGYSKSTIEGWYRRYRKGGCAELLKYEPPQGKQSRLTQHAWQGLCKALEAGQIHKLQDAVDYLREHHGISYQSPEGVAYLFKKFRVKLKTGRPKHRRKDGAAGAVFKKPSKAQKLLQASFLF